MSALRRSSTRQLNRFLPRYREALGLCSEDVYGVDGRPRRKLVVRQTGTDLADGLRSRIERWGCGPEESLGSSPDFAPRSVYFAWRSR